MTLLSVEKSNELLKLLSLKKLPESPESEGLPGSFYLDFAVSYFTSYE